MTASPRIWALLGAHAGDNNQVLALAEALGLPFEIKRLRYNHWRHLKPRILGSRLDSLDEESRALIAGDPPDLTISTGHRSVPVVQHLRGRSGGRTRSVHIGYPRIAPGKFDLVVATPEYPVPDGSTVMRIPFALTRRIDAAPFHDLPRPRRVLILGGPTLYWRFDRETLAGAVSTLLDVAAKEGGSLIAVASPRTPTDCLEDLPVRVVPPAGPPSYAALLAGADQLFVTADSTAMVSDAIVTGKPVGMIPIEPTLGGRVYAAMLPPGTRMRPRDLRFFWKALTDEQLVGTIEQPRAGSPPDLNALIATRVRDLLSRE